MVEEVEMGAPLVFTREQLNEFDCIVDLFTPQVPLFMCSIAVLFEQEYARPCRLDLCNTIDLMQQHSNYFNLIANGSCILTASPPLFGETRHEETQERLFRLLSANPQGETAELLTMQYHRKFGEGKFCSCCHMGGAWLRWFVWIALRLSNRQRLANWAATASSVRIQPNSNLISLAVLDDAVKSVPDISAIPSHWMHSTYSNGLMELGCIATLLNFTPTKHLPLATLLKSFQSMFARPCVISVKEMTNMFLQYPYLFEMDSAHVEVRGKWASAEAPLFDCYDHNRSVDQLVEIAVGIDKHINTNALMFAYHRRYKDIARIWPGMSLVEILQFDGRLSAVNGVFQRVPDAVSGLTESRSPAWWMDLVHSLFNLKKWFSPVSCTNLQRMIGSYLHRLLPFTLSQLREVLQTWPLHFSYDSVTEMVTPLRGTDWILTRTLDMENQSLSKLSSMLEHQHGHSFVRVWQLMDEYCAHYRDVPR